MKKETLILMLLLPLTVVSFGQKQYSPGATVKGEKVTYKCKKLYVNEILLINAQNRDTTNKIYYVTGEEVVDVAEHPTIVRSRYTFADLDRVMKEFVTPIELDSLKAKQHYFKILAVFDSDGNAREISFTFDPGIKEFQNISPDRYFLLEQKLKKLLTVDTKEMDRKIRNIKYSLLINFDNIPS